MDDQISHFPSHHPGMNKLGKLNKTKRQPMWSLFLQKMEKKHDFEVFKEEKTPHQMLRWIEHDIHRNLQPQDHLLG
jgi:hypothetical protein